MEMFVSIRTSVSLLFSEKERRRKNQICDAGRMVLPDVRSLGGRVGRMVVASGRTQFGGSCAPNSAVYAYHRVVPGLPSKAQQMFFSVNRISWPAGPTNKGD